MGYSKKPEPRPIPPSDAAAPTVDGSNREATGKLDSDKTPRHAHIGAVQVVAGGKFTCD
jgi:hypothetical protein